MNGCEQMLPSINSRTDEHCRCERQTPMYFYFSHHNFLNVSHALKKVYSSHIIGGGGDGVMGGSRSSEGSLGERCSHLLPSIVEQLGELLHNLRWCLHTGGNLPCKQVASPRVQHRPVLVCQTDEVGHWGLPLVLLQLLAVLHQQLSNIRPHHGLEGKESHPVGRSYSSPGCPSPGLKKEGSRASAFFLRLSCKYTIDLS